MLFDVCCAEVKQAIKVARVGVVKAGRVERDEFSAKAGGARAALGLDDSDEDEESLVDGGGSDIESEEDPRLAPRGGKRFSTMKSSSRGEDTEINITVSGQKMLALDHLRVIQVEATTANIKWVVNACMEAMKKAEGGKPKEAAQASWRSTVDDGLMSATPNIVGKIIWAPSQTAWAMTHMNLKGSRSTSYKGLAVATKTVAGEPLAASEFKKQIAKKYREAIVMWNQLDQSKNVRLAVPK
jgi:hypothetical protein